MLRLSPDAQSPGDASGEFLAELGRAATARACGNSPPDPLPNGLPTGI
jgi:hypothetical protein